MRCCNAPNDDKQLSVKRQDIADSSSSLGSHYEEPKSSRYRARTVLSKDQVREIYEFKKTLRSSERTTVPSINLARKYHVSSKTIRDIWSGRSWVEITRSMGEQVICT